jgi:septal ring factor EnvC (AmiA/AmiB activator)
MRSRSTRTAAGAVLGAGLVKRAETRQLLSLLAQLAALAESLAQLRDTQGRAAQALAARRAAEQLAGEQQRRAAAASAAVSSVVSSVAPSAVTGAATQRPVSVQLPPPHRPMSGPATRGASLSR